MKKISKKGLLLLVMVLVILTGTVGGTIAWISTKTSPVTNTFEPAKCEISINETVSGKVKSNVSIHNSSDFPVYIRAAVTANWADGNGNIVAPYEGTISYITEKWTLKDGYYYCKEKVAAGADTPVLFPSIDGTSDDYAELLVDIMAQGIQAEPAGAVTEAWGYTPGN